VADPRAIAETAAAVVVIAAAVVIAVAMAAVIAVPRTATDISKLQLSQTTFPRRTEPCL
jgi:cell division protein FtsN